ncbi:MAG: hypothetical protein R3277_12025 [Brumimicrobium sp.]|nr:hypothetical protein [Brumimicrobium sp.]
MVRISGLLVFSLILSLTSCSEGWNEENKSVVRDRCLGEVYDCDCYMDKTLEVFKNPAEYNTQTPEDKEKWETALKECEKENVIIDDGDIESF